MPDLSTLTVSLDTARALKDAGFPQDTVHYWHGVSHPWAPAQWVSGGTGEGSRICAAPTFAEVWALLPDKIHTEVGLLFLTMDRDGGQECAGYHDKDGCPTTIEGRATRPVEAAAALFLALVRAGHIQNTDA